MMYKFKDSLIALTGVLILVGIATAVMPRNGRSASGTSNSAPTSQTQNVNVVNTPTVNAQQSGAWNVDINGTPSVAVSNFPATTNVAITGTPTVGLDAASNTVKIDTSNVLRIRDVDNSARQPFAASCTIQNNNGFPCTVTTVPPGKRLVIEMFQMQAANIFPELIVVTQNTSIKYQFFQPSQLVRVYADPGSSVQAQGGPLGTVAAISGYLVDLP